MLTYLFYINLIYLIACCRQVDSMCPYGWGTIRCSNVNYCCIGDGTCAANGAFSCNIVNACPSTMCSATYYNIAISHSFSGFHCDVNRGGTNYTFTYTLSNPGSHDYVVHAYGYSSSDCSGTHISTATKSGSSSTRNVIYLSNPLISCTSITLECNNRVYDCNFNSFYYNIDKECQQHDYTCQHGSLSGFVSARTCSCECDSGWYGPHCDCASDMTCNSNGHCQSTGICLCNHGYFGSDCRCNARNTCNEHGTCDATGNCVCVVGYIGQYCDIVHRVTVVPTPVQRVTTSVQRVTAVPTTVQRVTTSMQRVTTSIQREPNNINQITTAIIGNHNDIKKTTIDIKLIIIFVSVGLVLLASIFGSLCIMSRRNKKMHNNAIEINDIELNASIM
jgi:hypothetical protein